MKQRIFWVVLACVTMASVASAASPSPALRELTSEQDMALRDFAASVVVAPPNVELVAELRPPTTSYRVRFVPADYKNINDRFSTWGKVGEREQFAGGAMELPFVESWDASISCGTWAVDRGTGTWSHPDGEAPTGCPHEQGTSHPGTITVTGTYAISVFLALSVATDPLMVGTWEFTCTYSGSESGTAQCEETLKDMKGRYGTTATGPQNQPRTTAAIIGAAAAAVVAAAYIFRERLRQILVIK